MGLGHLVVDKELNNPRHVWVGSLREVEDTDLLLVAVGDNRCVGVGAVDFDNQHVEAVADGRIQVAGHSSHHHQEVGLKDSDWLKITAISHSIYTYIQTHIYVLCM